MGQLIFFNMMTLDGFFESNNKELDWHTVDEEFNKFSIDQLDSAEILIFGRKTYEMMADYWPTEKAKSDDPVIAKKMNSIKKNVFSKTLDSTNWENTTLYGGNLTNVVSELKKNSEKNILIFGSANLCKTLIKDGLIDLYRIMVNPVVLGEGNPLFADSENQMDLKLINSKSFKSGNVLMEYKQK